MQQGVTCLGNTRIVSSSGRWPSPGHSCPFTVTQLRTRKLSLSCGISCHPFQLHIICERNPTRMCTPLQPRSAGHGFGHQDRQDYSQNCPAYQSCVGQAGPTLRAQMPASRSLQHKQFIDHVSLKPHDTCLIKRSKWVSHGIVQRCLESTGASNVTCAAASRCLHLHVGAMWTASQRTDVPAAPCSCCAPSHEVAEDQGGMHEPFHWTATVLAERPQRI